MRIELVGLPASGKSWLAEKLAQALPGRIAAPRGKGGLVWRGCGAVLRYLSLSFALLTLILRERNGRLRRSLLLNAWLYTAGKYTYKGNAVIDQGFIQSLVAALPQTQDSRAVSNVLTKFPEDVFIVWCEISASLRKERIAGRARLTREEFGEHPAARFSNEAERSYALVRRIAEDILPTNRMCTVDPSMPDAVEKIVRATRRASAQRKASMMHTVTKTIMLTLAFFVGRVAQVLRPSKEVVVLMYHAIDRSGWKLAVEPEPFEQHMRYLAEKRLAVPLVDIVSYIKKERELPARAVAVTFDDGYRDLLDAVLPILEQYRVPATIFVPSDLSVWTDPEGRARLTEEDIRVLAASPLITIGSHAKTHRKFTELSPEEARKEAEESALAIERVVGEPPRFFAYPFGARSRDAERIVEEAGYEAAFGITEGTIRRGDPLFALKRVQVDGMTNFLSFKFRLTSAVDWNRRLVNWLFAVIRI